MTCYETYYKKRNMLYRITNCQESKLLIRTIDLLNLNSGIFHEYNLQKLHFQFKMKILKK